MIYALPKLFIASFTLVLPFFPTGTSERMEDEGDVATAFTLARALSNIPISMGGPTSLVIYDIHALQVSAYMKYTALLVYKFVFRRNCDWIVVIVLCMCRRGFTLVIISYRALRVVSHCLKLGFNSSLTLTM